MSRDITVTTLGWVYNALTIAWTVILLAGMVFLYRHRKLPFLRIRRLPLVYSAVVLLHLYGVASMIAFTIGSLIPCDAQFWIMSIYLPFGMAMLQAANSQFLHVASQQRRYARVTSLDGSELPERTTDQVDPSQSWFKRTVGRVRALDQTTKIVVYIGLAMAVELALTFFIYFGSEIFHPSYGIFHVEVPGTDDRKVLCLTGWEWWLSIVWQFFWAWIYAPYLLWRTRNIHDTHGWRIQTICCCIAGLPASPLWLAALYIHEMAPVNAVVVPPQWFAFSIFFIELFTIFIPCWQVIKSHNLRQETLDAIASWEEKNRGLFADPESVSTTGYSGSTYRTSILSASAGEQGRKSKSVSNASDANSHESRKSDTSILTMVALENALRTNPQPLLEFAALKDFSGENVSFLTHVADWKRAAAQSSSARGELFIRAVQIYSHFVSLDLSEFPVNISSRAAKELLGIFDSAAKALHGRRRSEQSDLSSATPFDDVSPGGSTASLNGGRQGLENTLGKANLQSVVHMAELGRSGSSNSDVGLPDLPVPAAFGPLVFDKAEAEIKHLVLTNTWPKFVRTCTENNERSQKEKYHSSHMRKMLCGLGDIV